jgi:hypothetical protein
MPSSPSEFQDNFFMRALLAGFARTIERFDVAKSTPANSPKPSVAYR